MLYDVAVVGAGPAGIFGQTSQLTHSHREGGASCPVGIGSVGCVGARHSCLAEAAAVCAR